MYAVLWHLHSKGHFKLNQERLRWIRDTLATHHSRDPIFIQQIQEEMTDSAQSWPWAAPQQKGACALSNLQKALDKGHKARQYSIPLGCGGRFFVGMARSPEGATCEIEYQERECSKVCQRAWKRTWQRERKRWRADSGAVTGHISFPGSERLSPHGRLRGQPLSQQLSSRKLRSYQKDRSLSIQQQQRLWQGMQN